MIGLDTNVVVRFLAQDDPAQSAAATDLMNTLTDTAPGFLSLVTVVEVHWVLRRAYKTSAGDCADVIEGLLNARELRIEQESIVRSAVDASRGEIDFADAIIAGLGRAAGCEHTVTFDRRAARSAQMRLLTP